MINYYMDILINQNKLAKEIHSNLLYEIHIANKASNALFISYPEWNESENCAGRVLRVFSANQDDLSSFKLSLDKLEAVDLISISAVKAVPNSDKFVCFARENSRYLLSPSYIRRKQRRGGDVDDYLANVQQKESAPNVAFFMRSESTKQSFCLKIKRTNTATLSAMSYGLGQLVPDF